MINSIVEIFAAVIGYAAARGIDAIVGKWLAYFIIAWERRGSEKAKKAFSDTINLIKADSADKAAAWEEWRKRAASS